ncbi:hypothetical protein AB0M54_40180 [Actinoplanes sp. NPDC051470]|uniref:hypothetical protein n=1 Tax=unclassified Actinoplanes TaxID=2626549 RepID=UPI003414AAB0
MAIEDWHSKLKYNVNPEDIHKDYPSDFSDADVHNATEFLKRYASGYGDNQWMNSNWTSLTELDDEKAAYLKFRELVERKFLEDPASDGAYGEGTNYLPGDGQQEKKEEAHPPEDGDLPPPVAGGEDGDAKLAVNTEALKTFSSNLEKLRLRLATVAKTLSEDGPIKPGTAFSAAALLTDAVEGAAGVRPATTDYLTKIDYSFTLICDKIQEISKDYDNESEMNKMTAEKLAKVMTEPFGQLGGLEKKEA